MNPKYIVYKYSDWDNFCKDALFNRYFWFSKPTNFNDPFDSNMECLLAFEETNRLFNYQDEKQIGPLKNPYKYIKEQTDNFGILCLTKATEKGKTGNKGFNNSHFWSHYANHHKGIALGFYASKIESCYSTKYQCNAELTPVNYRQKPIDINGDNIVLEKKDGYTITKKVAAIFSKGGTGKDKEKIFTQLLHSKDSGIWEIENEYRIILGGSALKYINNNSPFGIKQYRIVNDNGYKIPYPNGEVLKEVTFGVKFLNHEIESAMRNINKHHKDVSFYQAILDFKNADVIRDRITNH